MKKLSKPRINMEAIARLWRHVKFWIFAFIIAAVGSMIVQTISDYFLKRLKESGGVLLASDILSFQLAGPCATATILGAALVLYGLIFEEL